jgi:hypothetical protein
MPIIDWRAEAVTKLATGVIEKRMARAVIIVRDQVKVLINRGNKDGTNPSAPGEPPKKVSGRLQKSIASRVTKDSNGNVVGLVGSNVPYEPRLELGFSGTDSLGRTYHQLPRPAFRPALEMQKSTIRQILGITSNGGGH